MTRIAPRELLGLSSDAYARAHFADEDGRVWSLPEQVLAHLTELVLAEQREIEKETGRRATQPRRRPKSKGGGGDAEGNTGRG